MLAVTGGRVQVLHLETGDREWIQLGEFLATYRAPRRLNPQRGPRGEVDEAAARELELFIENDADLYRQQIIPILKNLWRKMVKGTYDFEKSVKLVKYLADNGARKYATEFGEGREWSTMFSVPTRLEVARSLAQTYRTMLEGREFSGTWQTDKGAKRNPPGNMTITQHEAAEFSRAAIALYARGQNELGHLLSATAAVRTVPLAQYDRATRAYRAWLTFDEPKGNRRRSGNPKRRNPAGLRWLYVVLDNSGRQTAVGKPVTRGFTAARVNPIPRGIDKRSIRTVGRGKGRILVGCGRGKYHPRAKGRKCSGPMRRVNRARTRRPGKAGVRGNPSATDLHRAAATFKLWHGFDARKITRMRTGTRRIPATVVKLGELEAITYRSDKWAGSPDNPKGKRILYEHKTNRPRPVLATDPDGRHVFIIGGNMKVTADGLID